MLASPYSVILRPCMLCPYAVTLRPFKKNHVIENTISAKYGYPQTMMAFEY